MRVRKIAWLRNLTRVSVLPGFEAGKIMTAKALASHSVDAEESDSALSFGTKVAMDAAPTSSVGLGTFSPCRFAKA